jgi:integrase
MGLTDRFCSTTKAEGQIDYFDDTVFGLALRVSKTSKTWTLHYSRPSGKRARLTLGRYPVLSLATARARVSDNNGSPTAGLTFAYLSRVMNWHAGRDDDFRSPLVRGMGVHQSKARRDRVLSDEEIRPVWFAADQAGVFGQYVRFLLLTATRRNEAAHMVRAEVVGDMWTIPAERMKAKAEHVVPLSAAALDVLAKRPNNGEFIFTMDGLRPLGSFGHFKAKLDQAVTLSKPWTLHDLRRTARSLMSRAGVSADIAERCLAHVIGGVRGVYDRHAYLEEKRAAFEKLAAEIERIVAPQPNVVTMGRRE